MLGKFGAVWLDLAGNRHPIPLTKKTFKCFNDWRVAFKSYYDRVSAVEFSGKWAFPRGFTIVHLNRSHYCTPHYCTPEVDVITSSSNDELVYRGVFVLSFQLGLTPTCLRARLYS